MCGLSEAERDSTDGTRASPGNEDAVKEKAAVEKRQNLSFPVPGIGRHRGPPGSSPAPEDSSCSLPSTERSQLMAEATNPAPNKQAGDKAEMVSVVQPAGSADTSDCICEEQQEQHQPHAPPKSLLSQALGKKLNQSIQKVNEWFSKSRIRSPAPLQDVYAEERNLDLNPHLSEGDGHMFQETERMGCQWEVAAGCEGGRPAPKPVASRMVDKIFGRTYVRTRKPSHIHIPAEESCTAVDAKSCDTPERKTPYQKATLELTPEDVMKKRTAKEDREGAGRHAGATVEGDGHAFVVSDEAPGAVQRPAKLPGKEEAPGFQLAASPVGCHLHSLQNLSKPRNSLSKRSQQPGKPVCPLQVAIQGGSGPPEKAQAQAGGSPSSAGSLEGSSGQVPVRRSKRLPSQAAGEQWEREREPPQKRRKQWGGGEKKQKEAQAGNASPSAAAAAAEGGPGALQGKRVGRAGDVSKAGAFPAEEGSPRAECSCHVVPEAASQSSSLPLQQRLAEGWDHSNPEGKEFPAVPPAEQSIMRGQAPEWNGFCLQDVKETYKNPKVHDEVIGNRELNPETDDSELDAGSMWNVFHGCKRQSFLLHPATSKRPAAGAQTELSFGRAEGSQAENAKGSTPGIASVGKVSREVVSSTESEHLQAASQAVFPNSLCTPGTVKEAESENLLQSPESASNKKETLEAERTSNANSCSCGRFGLWRRGDFQGVSLCSAGETSSKTTPFLEMRPESDRNGALACSFCSKRIQPPSVACQPWSSRSRSGSVENKSRIGEQKQLKGTREQTVQMSSTGASEGHSEQAPKAETPGFALLSDTSEGLLGPAAKSSLNPREVDQQDALAVFAKTDQGSPLERDLECSSSSHRSESEPRSLGQAHRRRVRKLSSSEEEEDSSEDEELPCFQALAFGRSASTPSQLAEEEEAEIPAQRSSSQSSLRSLGEIRASPSQESEGSVNLFSSQPPAPEDPTSKLCDARLSTPVPTSQGKGMTSRTAIEPLGKIFRDGGQLQGGPQENINTEPNLGTLLWLFKNLNPLPFVSVTSSMTVP